MAKRNYSDKLRVQLSSGDSTSVWKGLKEITNYKTPSPSTVENQQLADNLKEFYCRFEKTPHTRSGHLCTLPLTPPATSLFSTSAIQISEDEVHQVFRKQKRKKNSRPRLQQSVWNPVLTSWPQSSQRSSTDHWNCAKSPNASNAPQLSFFNRRLNTFYARFECNGGSTTLPISVSGSSRQSSDDHVITVSEGEVRRELKRVNVRKAARPDGITGRVLRSCADLLAGLFTSIFNESLATSVVPTSFKKSVIIPVPKNSKPSCLNDYHPVALTSIVMKVFERLLKNHICSSIPVTLDPLQFAYRPNRSTDDAISHVLHSSLTHIDSKNGNYVRLLFIDYSSAFNTIVPIKLAVKLTDLGLNSSLCDSIQDFLTDRPQVVKVGQFTSNSITLNVGAPQGCVLSPLLYSVYTHNCVSSHSSTSIVKFADDTVVLGLISNNDEIAYLDEVLSLSEREQN